MKKLGSNLLDCSNLSVSFGGLQALQNINLSLPAGELVGLIGPNGAGKTTLFNVLTGVCRSYLGSIHFEQQNIAFLPPHQIVKLGIARTFQNIRLFGSLSVLDNVRVACHQQSTYGLFAAMFRLQSMQAMEGITTERSRNWLAALELTEWSDTPASMLPFGLQRRIEIARALATKPQLLLLDEPAAGMTTAEKADLLTRLRKLQNIYNLSVIVIEHDMPFIMELCPRIVTLDRGVLIADGTPAEIRANPKVIEAYLGASTDA